MTKDKHYRPANTLFSALVENCDKNLKFIGEPSRPGILDTPRRMADALCELTWGTRVDEEDFLASIGTMFESDYDQMVLVRDIPFVSLCEHHVLPFMGTAHVAYIPKDGKIIGLSKIPRLVAYYAARLQVQENLTRQVAMALEQLVQPLGVAVMMQAAHTCMSIRGARVNGSDTVTTELRGVFRTLPEVRGEFLLAVNSGK